MDMEEIDKLHAQLTAVQAALATSYDQLVASRMLTARLHVALSRIVVIGPKLGPEMDKALALGKETLLHGEPEHLTLLDDIRQCAQYTAQTDGDGPFRDAADRLLLLVGTPR